jgi:hypothetical protein
MWDVLFPGYPHPQSAIIGSYIGEMVPLLSGLWNKKKAEIISSVTNIKSRRGEVDSGLKGLFDPSDSDPHLRGLQNQATDRHRCLWVSSINSSYHRPVDSSGVEGTIQHFQKTIGMLTGILLGPPRRGGCPPDRPRCAGLA